MTESTAGLTIVIGSYLEADQVGRIAAGPAGRAGALRARACSRCHGTAATTTGGPVT